MGANVTYRPQQEADSAFLYNLYRSTRTEEIAQWGWSDAQAAVFLKFQHSAQQSHYGAMMPRAEHRIVCVNGEPVGRVIVDPAPDRLHLADISLMSDCRGRGVGTHLLQALKEEAAKEQRSIRLQVRRDNRALRLYTRLGFRLVGASGTDFELEWSPAAS